MIAASFKMGKRKGALNFSGVSRKKALKIEGVFCTPSNFKGKN